MGNYIPVGDAEFQFHPTPYAGKNKMLSRHQYVRIYKTANKSARNLILICHESNNTCRTHPTTQNTCTSAKHPIPFTTRLALDDVLWTLAWPGLAAPRPRGVRNPTLRAYSSTPASENNRTPSPRCATKTRPTPPYLLDDSHSRGAGQGAVERVVEEVGDAARSIDRSSTTPKHTTPTEDNTQTGESGENNQHRKMERDAAVGAKSADDQGGGVAAVYRQKGNRNSTSAKSKKRHLNHSTRRCFSTRPTHTTSKDGIHF